MPTVRTLIPLLPSGMEMEGDEIFKLTSKDGDIAVEKEAIPAAAPQEFAPDMIFEQEPSQLLNAILPPREWVETGIECRSDAVGVHRLDCGDQPDVGRSWGLVWKR